MMGKKYITDQTFLKLDFSKDNLVQGEYDNCVFNNCNLADMDLSHIEFTECKFTSCNLSTVKLSNTSFRDVVFDDCKMLGLHFGDCNPFLLDMKFTKCMLNLSSFYKLKMKGTPFKQCSIQEGIFIETDLSGSLFQNCDFLKTRFEYTILNDADFRTAFNYLIDPEMNQIQKAKFSKDGIAGLLSKYNLTIE